MLKLAGDMVLDWITHDRQQTIVAGGIGNVARGLAIKGFPVKVTTLYNPMTPILPENLLANNSVQDFNYHDIYIRDYDKGEFKRFKEGLRPNIFTLKDYNVIVAHKDSCIKEFTSHYADVRDTGVKGSCQILRMSSTDDWEKIRAHVHHVTALVTYKDKVEWFPYNVSKPTTIFFDEVTCVDDIGAGDTFNVGFLHSFYTPGDFDNWSVHTAIDCGLEEAQKKVQKVGVYID